MISTTQKQQSKTNSFTGETIISDIQTTYLFGFIPISRKKKEVEKLNFAGDKIIRKGIAIDKFGNEYNS